ncbi:ribonuclease HII [Verrucomicrobium spinosum]|uniref:ribonuclease HII n=1 Tax=Verrucomicrobium spinosum TaxID=2736 RepID=UPI00017443D3|nr:ribonuclease HII [Verrucomicrobium spinosum]
MKKSAASRPTAARKKAGAGKAMLGAARPTFRYEMELRQEGHQVVAGVDEAGRGPLAGPVSVAAVILPDDFTHAELHDSKQLTELRRERIYDELMGRADVLWCHVMVEVDEIDRINILQATRMGMRRAVQGLSMLPHAVLIDGTPVPDFPVPHRALVKGDALSLSIAAASVIAKVARDRLMRQAALDYPVYGFDQHKGYGTPEHLEALRRHGPCPLHRRSFSPVSQLTFAFDDL